MQFSLPAVPVIKASGALDNSEYPVYSKVYSKICNYKNC